MRSAIIELNVYIHRAFLHKLYIVIVGLNLFFLLGTAAYLANQNYQAAPKFVAFILHHSMLGIERNLASWYASLLLLLVAVAALVAWSVDATRASDQTDRRRWMAHGWWLIAAAFIALSLDEHASLHECLGSSDIDPLETGLSGWVATFLLPIVGVAFFFLLFGLDRLRYDRWGSALLVIGIILFLSVPLQEELETRWRTSMIEGSNIATNPIRPVLPALLEEGAELFGTMCFLAAFLRLPLASADGFILGMRTKLSRALGLVGTVSVFMLAGMLFLEYVVIPWGPVASWCGHPAFWFAALAALASGLLALWNYRTSKQMGGLGAHKLYRWLWAYTLFIAISYGAYQSVSFYDAHSLRHTDS